MRSFAISGWFYFSILRTVIRDRAFQNAVVHLLKWTARRSNNSCNVSPLLDDRQTLCDVIARVCTTDAFQIPKSQTRENFLMLWSVNRHKEIKTKTRTQQSSLLLPYRKMRSFATRNRHESIVLLIVLSILSSFSVTVVSSHQPLNSQGWSRRRIAKVAFSSSMSRAENNPFYSIITEVVSVSTKRKRKATKPGQEPLSIPQRLISGGCSRGIAQAVLYPVDALRTLAQTRDGRTLADVGGKALVRGCFTTSSFAVLIGSIQFCIFGATRNTCGPLVSSALGAAGSCLVSVPQEVIKQRLVTGVYSSFRSAVSTIYKNEGIAGFYSAWRPTVARNVPFVIAAFTTMDFLKQTRLKQKERNGKVGDEVSLTLGENLVVGISSALIAGTLTHPGR